MTELPTTAYTKIVGIVQSNPDEFDDGVYVAISLEKEAEKLSPWKIWILNKFFGRFLWF